MYINNSNEQMNDIITCNNIKYQTLCVLLYAFKSLSIYFLLF